MGNASDRPNARALYWARGRALRILHLADRLTDRGGAYVHLLAVLDALGADHESCLAVGVDEGTVSPRVRVRVVPGLESRTPARVELARLAGEVRPDVVHVHNLMNPDALAWAADHGRAVLTIQDHRYFCPTRGKWTTGGRVCRDAMSAEVCPGCFDDEPYFREVLGLTRARLDAAQRFPVVVVLSRYMRGEVTAGGLEPDRVAVIPPFVHGLDLAAPAEGPPCVLFLGRLVESKGVTDAVEAWRRAGLALPLVVAGAGPLRERVREEGAEVLGWVSRSRLGAVYARAKAVILSSRWQEPFGIVGLEALHCGVPVVAWRSGGIEEWHPGGDLLVPWGDVDALASSLRLAVTRRAVPPPGFDRGTLIARLVETYEIVARGPRM